MRNRKLWLLIFFILVMVVIYPRNNTAKMKAFEYDNINFGFRLAAGCGRCLYEAEDRGWFGDGEVYTVWQIEDIKPLLEKLNWKSGKPFQHELFVTATSLIELDKYYYPKDLNQRGWYYYIGCDKDGYDDDRMLLILVPQARLGDGVQYQHLLFIVELYS